MLLLAGCWRSYKNMSKSVGHERLMDLQETHSTRFSNYFLVRMQSWFQLWARCGQEVQLLVILWEDKSVLIQCHVPYILKKAYGISSHLPLRFSSELLLFGYIIAGFLHPLHTHKPGDQSPIGKRIIPAWEWASAVEGAHQKLLSPAFLPSTRAAQL